MPSIRRSIGLSLFERYASITLSLISFVVIARLLTPNDIGLYSLAVAVIGMAQVVRDFGVVTYLIQETELTAARIRTAFGITCVLSVLLFAVAIAVAPWAARFYADARLEEVMHVLCINFLLIPFGSTSMALLRREMRFGAICIVNLGASMANFMVALLLAYLGYGYMSLVWGSVASTAVTALLSLYFKPGDISLLPMLVEWRRVLGFGGRVTLTGVITEVSMNINDLVIGRVLGVTAVAIASRAQGVMNLMHRDMLGAVANVMFPALSKVRRDGGDLELVYQRCLATISVVAWPFYGFLALFPRDALRLLFGPQWDSAAGLVPWFCLAGAVAVFWKMVPSLLQAMGRVDLLMRAELLIQPSRIVMLTAIAVVMKSLEAFAAGFALVYLLCVPVLEYYRRLAMGLKPKMFTRPLVQSILVACATLFVPAAIMIGQKFMLVPQLGSLAFIAVCTFAGVTWVFACRILEHPISQDPAFSFLWNIFSLRRPDKS